MTHINWKQHQDSKSVKETDWLPKYLGEYASIRGEELESAGLSQKNHWEYTL